jgi:hypothetical protein
MVSHIVFTADIVDEDKVFTERFNEAVDLYNVDRSVECEVMARALLADTAILKYHWWKAQVLLGKVLWHNRRRRHPDGEDSEWDTNMAEARAALDRLEEWLKKPEPVLAEINILKPQINAHRLDCCAPPAIAVEAPDEENMEMDDAPPAIAMEASAEDKMEMDNASPAIAVEALAEEMIKMEMDDAIPAIVVEAPAEDRM